MPKSLLLIMFFCVFSLANPLKSDIAFENSAKINEQGAFINFDVKDSVYLYKNTLKVFVNSSEVTSLLNLPTSTKQGAHDVFMGKFELFVPFGLVLQEGNLSIFDIKVEYLGCALDGYCYPPQASIFHFIKKDNSYSVSKKSLNPQEMAALKVGTSISEQDKIANSLNTSSVILTIFTFFGYGLALALTPCVLPMVPILSSLIALKGGKDGSKSGFWLSFVYVLGMATTYAIAGVLAGIFGAGVQGLLQIPAVILSFCLVFVLLAFSMFGFYDINIPTRFFASNEKKGGYVGVFIMGAASGLVLSPCVAAPLVGALLFIANSGSALLGGTALFVLGFGMGAPLLVIGFGSDKFLPKPGIWMDEIKNLFGFIMLFMAVWMASRVIGDNISLGLYGAIGLFFAVYSGAFSGAKTALQRAKKAFYVLVFVYCVILLVGFASGGENFLRPLEKISSRNLDEKNGHKFTKISNLKELDEFLDSAKKPVMIDFWASWCANCKKLDDITFADVRVQKRLKEFELVKIDVSKNSDEDLAMLRKFDLFLPPALVFFSGKTELRDRRISGFVDSQSFLLRVDGI